MNSSSKSQILFPSLLLIKTVLKLVFISEQIVVVEWPGAQMYSCVFPLIWSQHTFPLPCEGERSVDDDVDLRGTVSHRHANFLQAGLKWCLACWETSGHWERRENTLWVKLKYRCSFSKKVHTKSHSHSHTLQLTLIPLPEATGRLELAAFRDATASATRDGYTHTAAVVTPDTQNNTTHVAEQ